MSSRRPIQCVYCAHFRSPLDGDSKGQTCDAFPAGIPDPIWWGSVDHRKPYTGDHAIRWEPRTAAATFPLAALTTVAAMGDPKGGAAGERKYNPAEPEETSNEPPDAIVRTEERAGRKPPEKPIELSAAIIRDF